MRKVCQNTNIIAKGACCRFEENLTRDAAAYGVPGFQSSKTCIEVGNPTLRRKSLVKKFPVEVIMASTAASKSTGPTID